MRFRDGQYSLVTFLSAVLLLTVPPFPATCKIEGGGTCPPCPLASSPLLLCQFMSLLLGLFLRMDTPLVVLLAMIESIFQSLGKFPKDGQDIQHRWEEDSIHRGKNAGGRIW